MQSQAQTVFYQPKKQFLSCKLCTDIFKKPITLTCGHTFCYYCLYKFMKEHCDSRSSKKKIQILQTQKPQQEKQKQITEQQNDLQDNIPIPLCPSCCSLILKPIKCYKQNLTLSNLISRAQYKPELKFDNQKYDEQIQNFNHKILITIQQPKVQPLPYCYTEVRFSTCFLDDILEQSHASYVVIQWPHFNKNIGLAGKILRTEVEYHSNARGKQSHYRAHFNGLFFVKILKKKSFEINLKSRYYTQSSFYLDNQQLAPLTICKCEQFHSKNILPLNAFDYFLTHYDTLNNPHYLNQIYRIVDSKPFFQRNNPEAMIYGCIRLLRLKSQQRKQIIQCFDDNIRIQKVNQFLQNMQNNPIQQIMYISIPGKYNSAFVFGVIFILILLHYLQSR